MGKTVLLSSHILSELAEVCTEIGIIESGKMVVSGPVEAVRRQLQGASRLRIKVLRNVEAAEVALRALAGEPRPDLPHLRAVRRDPVDERAVLVELDDTGEEVQASLLAHLMGQGLAVSEFRAQAENLEELFLRLTAAEEG
jgi:ABC-2 type transport system ATP-binding protein